MKAIFSKTDHLVILLNLIIGLGTIYNTYQILTKSRYPTPLPTSNSIPKQVLQKLEGAVVKAQVPGEMGGGTGFLLKTTKGQVYISNDHVCDGSGVGKDMKLTYDSHQDQPITVKVLATDPNHDLCVMEASGNEGIPLEVSEKPAEKYEDLYILGHPYLRPNTPATGLNLLEEDMEINMGTPSPISGCPEGTKMSLAGWMPVCVRSMLLTDTTIPSFPGNSGSPVVNAEGKVVGVINSGNSMFHGGYVPLRFLKEAINDY